MSQAVLEPPTVVAAHIQEREMERQESQQEMTARRSERGEGVISTAIAVLIVALLGVALWTGFSKIVDDASTKTSNQIQQIDGGAS